MTNGTSGCSWNGMFTLLLAVGVAVPVPGGVAAQPSEDPRTVEYALSFPALEHRWLQVDVVFPELDAAELTVRMSSASPGRYARHEFAKNVIDVQVYDGSGAELSFERPSPHEWRVLGHDGTVRVRYRLFGDRVDGTYLAVDSTHAHMNMPATLMWAVGLEDRPARVKFEPPAGVSWRVATQLFPTADAMVFKAPNLQYLLDSPTELSEFELRTFEVSDPSSAANRPEFRVAIHHETAPGAVDPYVAAVEKIVRETVTVFGEFPIFETNTYTFIADYLSYASGDAMEHRNSTVLTSSGRLDVPDQRMSLLSAVAHEFFHVWNVERIRPRSLEPFDFTDANISGELWLAEGFTNYYGKLVLQRSAIADLASTLLSFGRTLSIVDTSPGRQLNSAVGMSRLAAFTDAATAVDRTNFGNTFISYYTWGEAIGLGLDLTLRVRSGGRVTLDDYMTALWQRFGRPGGASPGLVDRPYTMNDAQTVLGEVAGDTAFAVDFFARFIDGHELVDYAWLLEHAGLVLRPVAPGQAVLGRVRVGSGLVVQQQTPYGSPLYDAGVERDDVLTMLDGEQLRSARDIATILQSKAPGDTLAIGFTRRGRPVQSTITLASDARLELVRLESAGGTLSSEQTAFRRAWLDSQQ